MKLDMDSATAYKYILYQAKLGKNLYFTGENAEAVGVEQFVAAFATIEFVEDIIPTIGEE